MFILEVNFPLPVHKWGARETFKSTHFTLLTSFSFPKAKGNFLRIIHYVLRVYVEERRNPRAHKSSAIPSSGVDNSTLCTAAVYTLASYVPSPSNFHFFFSKRKFQKKEKFSWIFFFLISANTLVALGKQVESCFQDERRKKAAAHTYFKASIVLGERRRKELRMASCQAAEKLRALESASRLSVAGEKHILLLLK